MTEPITCTPRTVPADAAVAAAEEAIRRNPQNRPAIGELAGVIPGFDPSREHLAVTTKKYWGIGGVDLSVGFLGETPNDLKDRIVGHMNAWGEHANIVFRLTDDADDAEVRINRELHADPNWDGYWSFLGTDILSAEGPFGQTMNLQEFTMDTPDSEFFRVVRHEAGHTLGFPHEHMRKELVEKIDRAKAIAFYKRLTGWSEAQIVQQVLTPLDPESLIGTLTADPASIMAYQVPGQVTKDGQPIIGGLDIDESDHKFCSEIYPKAATTDDAGAE